MDVEPGAGNMNFTLEEAIIIAVWVETLLYGIYTCLFFESLYIIFRRGEAAWNRTSKIFLCATVLMYCVATAHIAINLYRLLRGFVWLKETVGFLAYYADNARWDNVANNVLLCLMTWIGDSLVIYRCFIIWNGNYCVIVIPSAIVLSSIVVNVLVFCWLGNVSHVSPEVLRRTLNTIYPLAFAQNTITTSLIAFRIYKQHRASSASGVHDAGSPTSLINVVRIFVESAILYPAVLLILIVLYTIGHNAQFVLQAAVIPSIGIVFNLIAVRIHLARSKTLLVANSVMDGTMPDWLKDSTNSRHSTEPGPSRIRTDVQFDRGRLTKLELSPTMVLRNTDRLTETQ